MLACNLLCICFLIWLWLVSSRLSMAIFFIFLSRMEGQHEFDQVCSQQYLHSLMTCAPMCFSAVLINVVRWDYIKTARWAIWSALASHIWHKVLRDLAAFNLVTNGSCARDPMLLLLGCMWWLLCLDAHLSPRNLCGRSPFFSSISKSQLYQMFYLLILRLIN